MEVEMRVEVFDPDEFALRAKLTDNPVLRMDEYCERPTDVLCTVRAGDFPNLMDEVMGGVSDISSHFMDLGQIIELRCGMDSTDLEADDYDDMSQALEIAEELLRENQNALISITLE